MTYGQNGNTLVIDNGKKTVLVLDENDRLIQRCVLHFSVDDPAAADVFSASKTLLFKLAASPNGSRVLVTDQVGFYRFDEAGESVYVDEVEVAYFHRIILTWAALVLGLLALAVPLFKLVGILSGAAGRSDNALRVLLIVLASLSVASVLSYTLMQNIMDTSTGGTEKALQLFSEILMADTDPDALTKLNGPTDYNSAPFLAVKDKLDAHTRDAYERGDYYYYILYRSVGGRIVIVMDFEDSQPCTYPMYPDDPEDNDYAFVMNTGEELVISGISSYGAWSFLLRPVYDENGYIAAVLEVGQSLDALQRSQQELRRELDISMEQHTTFAKFMRSRRVIGFFGLVLVPFMMALSYREYFFPLFAQESGIAIFCIAMVVFTALFAFMMRKDSALYE